MATSPLLEGVPDWVQDAILVQESLYQNGEIIRFLQDCVNRQACAAVLALLDVDPTDYKRIEWLQMTANRAQSFAKWLSEADNLGEQAMEALKQLDEAGMVEATGIVKDA